MMERLETEGMGRCVCDKLASQKMCDRNAVIILGFPVEASPVRNVI